MTPLKTALAILLILSVFLSGYRQTSVNTATNDPAANKEIVKKLFDEVINKKNMAVFDQAFAADVIDHSAFPDQLPGRDGLKKAVSGMFEAYPDINVKIQEMIAEGDFVVTRDLWSATEKSSGKKRSGWVIHIIKLKDGIVTEEWSKGWEWLSGGE